jgi:lauroyl/myristoyl acyltransferase
VLTNSTIGRLELLSGAAIVTSIAHPLPEGRIRIDCQELPYRPSGDDQADVQSISQRCLEFCEAVIRDQPEHWVWSYKRWRARPHPELGRFPAYSRQYGL